LACLFSNRMSTNRCLSILLLTVICCWADSGQATAKSYGPRLFDQSVAVVEYNWHDVARNRDVPVKIYYPAASEIPSPVIIFSHGLGGTREGYEYLGRHWAGCGYVSVHIQHLGSDDLVWKNASRSEIRAKMIEAANDLSNALNRPKDVSFVIDQLLKLNASADWPLHGRLNTKGFGMAGHSFGAWTTLAEAGETFGPTSVSVRDPRIIAAVALSPPVPRQPAERDRAFGKITIPVFQITGTLDDSPIGEAKAAERRIPFDKMTKSETSLVILAGADHMTFANHLQPAKKVSDAKFHSLVCAATTAFWDTYLGGDVEARHWLYDGGFARLLGADGTFEKKLSPR
jgi:predicted dienelactone hydrolase